MRNAKKKKKCTKNIFISVHIGAGTRSGNVIENRYRID